jgi:hypothetical protein
MKSASLKDIGRYASLPTVLIFVGLLAAGRNLTAGGGFSAGNNGLMWEFATVALGLSLWALRSVSMGSLGYFPEPSKPIWSKAALLDALVTFSAFLLFAFAGETGRLPYWLNSLLKLLH